MSRKWLTFPLHDFKDANLDALLVKASFWAHVICMYMYLCICWFVGLCYLIFSYIFFQSLQLEEGIVEEFKDTLPNLRVVRSLRIYPLHHFVTIPSPSLATPKNGGKKDQHLDKIDLMPSPLQGGSAQSLPYSIIHSPHGLINFKMDLVIARFPYLWSMYPSPIYWRMVEAPTLCWFWLLML